MRLESYQLYVCNLARFGLSQPGAASFIIPISGSFKGYPIAGDNFLAWLEASGGGASTTLFYGAIATAATAVTSKYGITGSIFC